MVITHDFTLDFSRADIQVQLNGFRTGDKDVHQLNPTYKNAGVPWAPDDGAHFRFFASLPSGAMVYMDFGETLVLPSSVLAEVGVVSATVEIAKGDQVLYAPMFSLNVQAGDSGADHIEASDDFSALISATRDANVAKQACVDEVAKVEQMLEDGEFDGPPGPQGPPGEVTPGSITTAKIANGAVTGAKIANGAVTGAKIANGAITNAKLEDYRGLPNGYTRLRYLQSTGEQYILTRTAPVVAHSDGVLKRFTVFRVVAQPVQPDYEDETNWVFGSMEETPDLAEVVAGVAVHTNDVVSQIAGTLCRYSDVVYPFRGVEGGTYDTDFAASGGVVGLKFLHNGVASQLFQTGVDISTAPAICLFGVNTPSGVIPSLGAIVQRCGIDEWFWNEDDYVWESEAKQRFVPALDQYGVPCMYDTISQTPFYNAGSGQFLFG